MKRYDKIAAPVFVEVAAPNKLLFRTNEFPRLASRGFFVLDFVQT